MIYGQAGEGIVITATVYMSKGDHFFFTCNQYDTKLNIAT
jgi:hypothetical protein